MALNLQSITADECRAYMARHWVSMFEAKKALTGREIRRALTEATTLEDLTEVLQVMANLLFPKDLDAEHPDRLLPSHEDQVPLP